VTVEDVAMVAPYPYLRGSSTGLSGVATYTERLSRALADQGVAVRVLAPEADGEPARTDLGGVTVDRCYRRGMGALTSAANAAGRGRAPVVHIQFETFLYGGPTSVPGIAPALAALRRRQRGPVVTMHQVVDPSEVNREFTRMHRVRVPSTAARVGMSAIQRTVQALAATTVVHEQAFGRIVPNSVVVPLGIDAPSPVVPRADESTPAHGVHPGRLVVLCFGYLSPYKGLEVALEAAALAGEAVELVVAGGSHPRLVSRDSYAEQLRQRYGHVARFVGYVPEDEVAALFGMADVLLLPYPRPFSSSGPLAQALGFGTPVLCSAALAGCIGAPPVMAVPSEPAGLAARLVELASDSHQLRGLAAATDSLAAGRTWEEVARRHISLYEEVIDARRTAGRRFWPRESRG
jgi:glycosyltransferase involved in cell wall biosynthesis